MGLCLSSCRRLRRRQRRSNDSSRRRHQYSESEESPLLGDSVGDSQPIHAVNLVNKAVEVVAALKNGKYPSQDQVDSLLRWFLQSDVLRESRYTRISEQGQQIIHGVHRLCSALLVFGVEKNGDDRLQDLLFLADTISRPLDHAIEGGKTSIEADPDIKVPHIRDLGHDLEQFIDAAKSLLVLLFTSTAARILILNIVALVQEIVANFASDISDVAQQVQDLAEGVGKIAEGVEATVEGISKKSEGDANTPGHQVAHTPTRIDLAVREVADSGNAASAFMQNAKHRDSSDDQINIPCLHTDDSQPDSAAEGIQAILVEAHQDPRCIAALKTVLYLLEKYLSIWQELGTMLSHPSPLVSRFNSIAADTKILLERLASGKSLDPLCATMSNLMTAVTSVPGEDHSMIAQLRDYLTDLRRFLVRDCSELSYVKSNQCKTDISQMIHRGRIIMKAARSTENLFGSFIDEAHTFTSALSRDHTTIRLLRAFTTLSTDIHDYLTSVGAPTTTRGSLCLSGAMWNDIAAVVMNTFLSLTRNIFRPNGAVIIPIPRVEYGDQKLDVAVDGRLMRVSLVDNARNEGWSAGVYGDRESDTPNWLTPSSILVRRWSELHLDFAATTVSENGTAITSSNKVNVHIDGVFSGARHSVVSLDDLGYFFRFKSLLGYEDEGVLGLDIGFCGFCGLDGGAIDIILELDTQSAGEDHVDFSIASVTVTLPPSLDIAIELIDSRHWILNAMLTPIVLPLVKWFVRRELEKLVEQWIRSAINSLAHGLHAVRDETQKDGRRSVWTAIANVISSRQLLGASPVDKPDVRTETTVSLKGVQIQQVEADAGGESQSTLAIGFAPQIFPYKGELQPLVSPTAMYEHVASEVSDHVANVEERLVDAEQRLRDGVTAVDDLIDRAGDKFARTESRERRIDGWRSHTFDM